jgi:hypothetical protein
LLAAFGKNTQLAGTAGYLEADIALVDTINTHQLVWFPAASENMHHYGEQRQQHLSEIHG